VEQLARAVEDMIEDKASVTGGASVLRAVSKRAATLVGAAVQVFAVDPDSKQVREGFP
jgi:hypothetical protein